MKCYKSKLNIWHLHYFSLPYILPRGSPWHEKTNCCNISHTYGKKKNHCFLQVCLFSMTYCRLPFFSSRNALFLKRVNCLWRVIHWSWELFCSTWEVWTFGQSPIGCEWTLSLTYKCLTGLTLSLFIYTDILKLDLVCSFCCIWDYSKWEPPGVCSINSFPSSQRIF